MPPIQAFLPLRFSILFGVWLATVVAMVATSVVYRRALGLESSPPPVTVLVLGTDGGESRDEGATTRFAPEATVYGVVVALALVSPALVRALVPFGRHHALNGLVGLAVLGATVAGLVRGRDRYGARRAVAGHLFVAVTAWQAFVAVLFPVTYSFPRLLVPGLSVPYLLTVPTFVLATLAVGTYALVGWEGSLPVRRREAILVGLAAAALGALVSVRGVSAGGLLEDYWPLAAAVTAGGLFLAAVAALLGRADDRGSQTPVRTDR